MNLKEVQVAPTRKGFFVLFPKERSKRKIKIIREEIKEKIEKRLISASCSKIEEARSKDEIILFFSIETIEEERVLRVLDNILNK